MDTKRAPRIRDPILLRLLRFEMDECEVTGVTTGLHLHHVILRSQQGSDLRENIICLGEDFHRRYHEADPVIRRILAEHIVTKRPDVAGYIKEFLGEQGLTEWLRRHGILEIDYGN